MLNKNKAMKEINVVVIYRCVDKKLYGQNMKKIALILVCLIMGQLFADDGSGLDTISFDMTARQWVNTETALVSVSINMTLNSTNVVKARQDIMDKLQKIAKGEWHITQFDRSVDSSGLEKISVNAQSRIMQADLTPIYQNAKSVSLPGASFSISAIEFKPSLVELQNAKAKLRETLYGLIKEELTRINKIYSPQNFTINDLSFSEGGPIPVARNMQGDMMSNAMVLGGAAPLVVSNELTLQAQVKAASNRQPSIAK